MSNKSALKQAEERTQKHEEVQSLSHFRDPKCTYCYSGSRPPSLASMDTTLVSQGRNISPFRIREYDFFLV